MSTITKGSRLVRRRTGVSREVIGFTTKPSPQAPSDGVRRARLSDGESETRVRLDQISKTYTTFR
jgi:hypothetical protein